MPQSPSWSVLDVSCPACDAPPGTHCTPGGLHPHQSRLEWFRRRFQRVGQGRTEQSDRFVHSPSRPRGGARPLPYGRRPAQARHEDRTTDRASRKRA
ncbi:zinc finger domain-containing protein [Streptomyces shenzhenensis]|uniref:zinc finger domain-containing protein n=1 Tax=Streptomyces shenzhenensis TaxID=943815 RepID=UPI003D9C40C3